MNPAILALMGLVTGLIFGLAVAWGWISGLYVFAGIGVFLVGAMLPTMARTFFGLAIFGFVVSWLVSSGVEML